MDFSRGQPGDQEGGPGPGLPGGLLWEQVCSPGGLEAGDPAALGLGLLGEEPFLLSEPWSRPWGHLSFHLAPQIEPPSHHFSPEEVRIRVLGRQ